MQKDIPVKVSMLLGLFLVLLCGCSTSGSPPPPSPKRSVPPPVEGRAPVEQELVERALPERPVWIDNEPDDRDGMYFMVGVSNHHTSEQEAREEAMRHARGVFAAYTGVEVSSIDEMVQTLYGSASGVLDGTISGIKKDSATVDARVSRIKAVQWYWEKYRATSDGIYQGVNYRYWVLVSVPQDELARVELWLTQKKEAEHAEWQAFVDGCGQRLAEIDELIADGEVQAAMGTIMAEWTRLAARIDGLDQKKTSHASGLAELRQLQRNVEGRMGALRNAIRIDTGRFGSQCFLPGNGPAVISVWGAVRTAEGKMRPLENFPLVLRDGGGRILARAVSGLEGRTDFHLPAPVLGNLQVSVDTESGAGSMPAPLLRSLARVENCVTAIAADSDLDGAIRMAVADLFRGPSSRPLPAKRVVVGPVTYGETGLGSEFAPLLKRQLSEYLTRVSGLEVVVPRPREVAAVARAAQTRGITAHKTPSLGSAATQAWIDQADAGLETTYSFFGEEEVRVSLALKEAGTDILLGAASASIDRRTLPPGISLTPAASASHPLPRPAGSAGIRLELTSHLGDGQTYAEGESISYFVSLDRDAYLLLIYEDAGGNLIRILPNSYSGEGFYRQGSTIEIPGKDDGFEFTIAPPFGVERVWAFAASVPFPSLPGTELENGLLLLSEDLSTSIARVRTAAAGKGYGEALTTVTTVPGRSSVALNH